jgi:nucleoside phosphorylase
MVTYPGATEDRPFGSTYPHKHHEPFECAICDGVCDKAVGMSCEELKCHQQELVLRRRLSQPYNPVVHFGLIASGDTVMKSGEDRDDISTRDRVIAFEMEGAGV